MRVGGDVDRRVGDSGRRVGTCEAVTGCRDARGGGGGRRLRRLWR
jgi:hypothetical protein